MSEKDNSPQTIDDPICGSLGLSIRQPWTSLAVVLAFALLWPQPASADTVDVPKYVTLAVLFCYALCRWPVLFLIFGAGASRLILVPIFSRRANLAVVGGAVGLVLFLGYLAWGCLQLNLVMPA